MLSEKPWRADKVIIFGTLLFVCLCFGMATAGALHEFEVKGFRNPGDIGMILVGTISLHGAVWPLMFFFMRQHQVSWKEGLGFRGPATGRALLWAVGITALALPTALFLKEESHVVLKAFGFEPSVQTAVKMLQDANSIWLQVYLSAFAIVIAPVSEEFVFRGVLYPFFKRLGFPVLAWCGVSLVFALMHLDATTFVPLFVLALGLTWLYERTDNLLAPIAAHSLFNGANVVLSFLDTIDRSPASK